MLESCHLQEVGTKEVTLLEQGGVQHYEYKPKLNLLHQKEMCSADVKECSSWREVFSEKPGQQHLHSQDGGENTSLFITLILDWQDVPPYLSWLLLSLCRFAQEDGEAEPSLSQDKHWPREGWAPSTAWMGANFLSLTLAYHQWMLMSEAMWIFFPFFFQLCHLLKTAQELSTCLIPHSVRKIRMSWDKQNRNISPEHRLVA